MLDSDNKETLNILKRELEKFSKESKVVNGMFEKKYHTDYDFSIREDKRMKEITRIFDVKITVIGKVSDKDADKIIELTNECLAQYAIIAAEIANGIYSLKVMPFMGSVSENSSYERSFSSTCSP